MPEDDPCVQCGHPNGPHLMVSTREDPKLGGIRLCPECEECFATWDVPPFSSREDVRVPGVEELAAIRKQVLG